MAESQSIIGYVPDAVAHDLQSGKGLGKGPLELPLDPGKKAAHIRVNPNDIHEVRIGPSSGGHTSLQLVLKPEADYEFVAKASKAEGLTAIQDPAFIYGLGRLRWFVIYVGPIFRQQQLGVFKQVVEQQ
jgi:hypothetical protein